MATNVVYNVFNGDDCAYESMTKEQIYELIANSIAQGELAGVDAENPFITKIKEQNKGVPLTFWVGTQAEFNAIETKANNCFYIITDSTAQADIENRLENLETNISGLNDKANDTVFLSNMLEYLLDGINGILCEAGTGRVITATELTNYRIAYFIKDDFSHYGFKTVIGGIETDPMGLSVIDGSGDQDSVLVQAIKKGSKTEIYVTPKLDKDWYIIVRPYTEKDDVFTEIGGNL